MEQTPHGNATVATSNSLIERVKAILTNPQKEWQVINSEPANPSNITVSYIIPLALIGTVAIFLSYGVFGIGAGIFKFKSISFGIKMAVAVFISCVVGPYITALIVDNVGPNFGAEKNFGKSFQVAAYSATPGLICGIFYIFHSLTILAVLGGLYGLYLLYIGLPVLKPVKEADKKTNYFVVVLIVSIIVNYLLYWLPSQLFTPTISDISVSL